VTLVYVPDAKFPDTSKKFPVPCNIFPVKLRRELREKRLRAAVSCYEIDLGSPEIGKFPVIFPVSRELPVETGSHMTAHTTIQS
jgi:hypothetical protein